MTTYNGERFIYEQIDSILSQLSVNDEVIISDDSSTDKTVHIIESYDDNRIKILKNNTFYSTIFNIENALKMATGDLIFLSDQDDVWERNKVEISIKYLNKYDLFVSDCYVIDEHGGIIYDSFFKLQNSKVGFIKNICKNSYVGCCMAFNRGILEKALPFPRNIPMHDMWIGFIAEVFGKSFFGKDKLVRYRRHERNMSVTTKKSSHNIIDKLMFRSNLTLALLFRFLSRCREKKQS